MLGCQQGFLTLTDVVFLCHCLCSLKVQQGLLIDFTSFPQKFIDLLNLCYSEQESDNPRYEEMQTTMQHHTVQLNKFSFTLCTDLHQF